MGFFSDLKEDLSQAVNELIPEEPETVPTEDTAREASTAADLTAELDVSLEEMLKNIDDFKFPAEDEAGEDIQTDGSLQTAEEAQESAAEPAGEEWNSFSLDDMLAELEANNVTGAEIPVTPGVPEMPEISDVPEMPDVSAISDIPALDESLQGLLSDMPEIPDTMTFDVLAQTGRVADSIPKVWQMLTEKQETLWREAQTNSLTAPVVIWVRLPIQNLNEWVYRQKQLDKATFLTRYAVRGFRPNEVLIQMICKGRTDAVLAQLKMLGLDLQPTAVDGLWEVRKTKMEDVWK